MANQNMTCCDHDESQWVYKGRNDNYSLNALKLNWSVDIIISIQFRYSSFFLLKVHFRSLWFTKSGSMEGELILLSQWNRSSVTVPISTPTPSCASLSPTPHSSDYNAWWSTSQEGTICKSTSPSIVLMQIQLFQLLLILGQLHGGRWRHGRFLLLVQDIQQWRIGSVGQESTVTPSELVVQCDHRVNGCGIRGYSRW